MTKAELEHQFNQFKFHAEQCHSYHRSRVFGAALDAAGASLPFADGMLQFAKRFGSGPPASVNTADYIIFYAPILFNRASLQKLEDGIAASRRLAKGETWDYTHAVSSARSRMELSRRLWNAIQDLGEMGPQAIAAVFGNDVPAVKPVLKAWGDIGLLLPASDGRPGFFQFATSFGRPCDGKCSKCGEVTTAPKSMFLEDAECPACRAPAHFALIG